MEAEELLLMVRQRPFEPFRLCVSDGTAYEVRHPDQIIVSKRTSHVGLGGNGDRPFPRIAIVSNVHSTRIEPIDGNGRKKRPRYPC